MAQAKRRVAKKTPAKKRSTSTKKKSVARKSVKKSAPKKVTKTARKPTKRSAPKKRVVKQKTAYEKRNESARGHGYESYWDERQSRVRARDALRELGHPNPDATDPQTLRAVDDLGTLGRGDSARELYYKTKRVMGDYMPSPTDQQIWSLIRIFYKPRGRR